MRKKGNRNVENRKKTTETKQHRSVKSTASPETCGLHYKAWTLAYRVNQEFRLEMGIFRGAHNQCVPHPCGCPVGVRMLGLYPGPHTALMRFSSIGASFGVQLGSISCIALEKGPEVMRS